MNIAGHFLTRLSALIGACALFAVVAGPAGATNIERVVTPAGVEVWLVRDQAVPLITIEFSFDGGSSQDPDDKPGVANFTASMLDEGAGDLDSNAFAQRMERKAIEFSVRAGRDSVRGSMRTLSENRDEAFGLLKLALNAPRFDAQPLERVRAQIMSSLQRETMNPGDIASRRWWQTTFPDHPYGRPVSGTLESVPQISADDLRTYTKRILARNNVKIGVVGDVDAESVKRLVDEVFGGLPAKANLRGVPNVEPKLLGRPVGAKINVPQAVVMFGGPGIARDDPQFMAAYVANHVLGGGSFSSRLYREVREKRGLAYSVYSAMFWLQHAALFIGTTATRADRVEESVNIIEREIREMAEQGPTEDELAKAKSYLASSFALNLDTSAKIASQLVQMQVDNLGIDYIDRRAGLIDAVTLEDAKKAAKRLFGNGLQFSIAGPTGDDFKAQDPAVRPN